MGTAIVTQTLQSPWPQTGVIRALGMGPSEHYFVKRCGHSVGKDRTYKLYILKMVWPTNILCKKMHYMLRVVGTLGVVYVCENFRLNGSLH